MDVDKSFSEQTLLGDVSNQMEQLLTRPNITYDGKAFWFLNLTLNKEAGKQGGCINGMFQYLSIK